ncbi:MAG: hypothetical protein RQ982_10845 [Gammaproteobacteria bacterium]|nr:hypothetical protein [Gammaproteobacteria bacterium]
MTLHKDIEVEKMLNFSRKLLLVSLAILSISCASYDQKDENKGVEPGALDLIICKNPRPEICTREYDPVCATLKDGSTKTGATGCTSCSDPEVVGYKMGACGIVAID